MIRVEQMTSDHWKEWAVYRFIINGVSYTGRECSIKKVMYGGKKILNYKGK